MSDHEGSSDDDLDVGSERFDPLRALYAKDYVITKKKSKVLYQNIAAFESALKKYGISQLNKPRPQASTNAAGGPSSSKLATASTSENDGDLSARRFQPHQAPIKGIRKKRHQRNLYTHMSSMEGPLAALQKYLPSPVLGPELRLRARVRVVLRKENGVRGSIEGELVAFDKQWNLLLINAVEVWKRRKYKYGEQKICGVPENCSERLLQLGIAIPHADVKSLSRMNVQLTRKIPQIMVRGENVVLVSSVILFNSNK